MESLDRNILFFSECSGVARIKKTAWIMETNLLGGVDMNEEKKRTRCEVYSRVTGFLTPISQWNKGKREEFRDRKTYKV